MGSPVVLINDVPVIGASTATWTVTGGVNPTIERFNVHPDDLPSLLKLKQHEAWLSVGGVKWERLSVIGHEPASDPFMTVVVVTDSRYWWPWVNVQLPINLPRRVGRVHRDSASEFDKLREGSFDKVAYKAYSLNPKTGNPWTAPEAIKEAIKRAEGKEPKVAKGAIPSLTIRMEGLDIDTDGASAVQQVTRYANQVAPYPLPAGGYEIRSVVDGSEAQVLKDSGAEIIGGGHIQVIDRAQIMPSAVDVLFTPEMELRVDCRDVVSTAEFPSYRADIPNVGIVTDFQLTLVNKEQVAAGTYESISNLIAAWRNFPNGSVLVNALTDDILRQAMVPRTGASLWAPMNAVGLKSAGRDAALWSSRLAMLAQYYRMAYQFPREWIDNIRHIRPYLCATIDRRSGQRAPATVYSDHAIVISDLGFELRGKVSQAQSWLTNVSGYPGVKADPAPGQQPAPYNIAVEDEDQGVIRFIPRLDPYGTVQAIVPSKVDNAAGRHLRRSKRNKPLAIDEMTASGIAPALSRSSNAAAFLTVVPATGLLRLRIPTKDLANDAPEHLKASFRKARGPVREVRIPGSVETARIAWSIKHAQTVYQAITGTPEQRERAFAKLLAAGRVINNGPQKGLGSRAASLPAIARAAAMSVCAAVVDSPSGMRTVGFNPKLEPTGRIASMAHEVRPDGARLTRMQMYGVLPQQDLLHYLPMDVQSVILRTVN